MDEQPIDSVIQETVGIDDDQPFTLPSKEDLLALLDTMEISDEEKEQIRDSFVNNKPILGSEKSIWTYQFLVLICLLLLVASIFGKFY